jgi:molybdate transport system ATP-binding protein
MLGFDLTVSRGDFSLRCAADVGDGVTAVFGPSGAGKSTLLHAIAGLIRPAAGRLMLDGATLFDAERSIWTPPHRRRIAVVFQDGRLFPHYSVRKNLCYGAPRGAGSARHQSFGQAVELLALGELLDRRTHGLSGGERQRVALGRALLSEPRLILLDEPLASLDAGLKRQIIPFLRRVIELARVPMLYVSHDVGEILQFTDSMLVLDRGEIVGRGPFHEVLADPSVFGVARRLGMENVLAVRVTSNSAEDGLTRLAVAADGKGVDRGAAAEIVAPIQARAPGAVRRICVRPEDVALASDSLSGVSIQNQIRGTIRAIREHAGVTLVEVDIGSPLLAEVSPRAARTLGLRPGAQVTCVFKAHAVRYLDG